MAQIQSSLYSGKDTNAYRFSDSYAFPEATCHYLFECCLLHTNHSYYTS